MSKVEIQTTARGFKVNPTQERIDDQARQSRMLERKTNPKASPTLRDIQSMILDLFDEIVELKQK